MWRKIALLKKNLFNCDLFQTNEVNQGDALEHDFSCLYAALLFPIKHQLPEKLAQVSL